MIDVFLPMNSIIKISKIRTDNSVFCLHYKVTVSMLLVFFILVTSKQFFGDPVLCKGDVNSPNMNIINTYCWNYGTYTLKSKLKGIQGKHYTYPGVGQSNLVEDDMIHHTHYQWISLILLLQAFMFYLPRHLWTAWEGDQLKDLCENIGGPLEPDDWTSRCDKIVKYFCKSNSYSHTLYILRYSFCELLNLANVVGQMYILNIFLGGAFENYGSAVAAFNSRVNISNPDLDNVSPMDKYFPKMASCNYYEYGPSGSITALSFVCALPLNIFNAKIFVILWFWFLFLALITAITITFRFITFSILPFRILLMMGHLRFSKYRKACKLVKQLSYGDWYMLYSLGKNVNTFLFQEIILAMAKALEEKKKNNDFV